MKSVGRLFDENAMGVCATGVTLGAIAFLLPGCYAYNEGYDLAMMTVPALGQMADVAKDAVTGMPNNEVVDEAVSKGFESVGDFFFNNKIGIMTGLAGLGSFISSAIIYNVAKKREHRRHFGYYD